MLLGLGGATFAAHTRYGADPTWSVAIGDLNGDGRPDLAMGGDAGAGVMLGNGDGTFGARVTYVTGGPTLAVAIGDLDGDGRADLAAVNSGRNTISVLPGKGDGSFGAKQEYGAHNSPYHLAIGDLDGDGKPDLVTANYYPFGSVSVLRNARPDPPIAIGFESALGT